ncbi:anthrone oxygenase family protein [Streptomyces sp900105245]|uniref:anthrone oxygenase family protein n=1 Tax=Streptomyces sp. 900105245 TaxID=3154379 RepID=UPI0033218B9A
MTHPRQTPRPARAGRTVLGAATVAMGLIAGVFYAFACAVMPALARADDRTYVAVMRDINDVIQNPVFFLSFLGALVLTAVSAWQLRGSAGGRWAGAALVAYTLAFLVTVAFSVPLNDALAGGGTPASLREHFEGPWVAWNVVRTVLSTVALGCLARALLRMGAAAPAGGRRHPAPDAAAPSGPLPSHAPGRPRTSRQTPPSPCQTPPSPR